MTQKIAVVTGAGRGIGKAVALNLAKQDYHVIIIDIASDTLQQTYEEILALGESSSHYTVNVSDSSAVKKCIENIVKNHHRIDLLFNNAGIAYLGTSDLDDHIIDAIIGVNLQGAIYVAKYVANQMKKQQSGYIINMSSYAGKTTPPTMGAYAASKFGLAGYAEALFKEMMPYNVKVTTICPSFVATEMTKQLDFDTNLMIPISDIIKTVNYLLKISANAAIQEVVIRCSACVAQETKLTFD